MRAKINLYNQDCMIAMKKMRDNQFDLAIVDPPYGINFGKFNRTNRTSSGKRYKANKYKNSNWDNSIPTDIYFKELQRVSKNQIIWGANYFPCLWKNGCKGFIFWYKENPVPNFADGELAYTSFNKVARQFHFKSYGNIEGKTSAIKKQHPTQKPIALYKWLLKNYAIKGDKILDTHLGSGTLAIACWDMKFDLEAYEIDKDYYGKACKIFNRYIRQGRFF